MSPSIRKRTASVVAITLAVPLCACATRPIGLEAPYDDLTFQSALPEPEPPKPVAVVEVPKVLPLPGQLKPLPGKGAREEKIPPEQAIAKANQAARIEPTHAIQVSNPGLWGAAAACGDGAPSAAPMGRLLARLSSL